MLITLSKGKKIGGKWRFAVIAAVPLPFLHISTLFSPMNLIIPKENLETLLECCCTNIKAGSKNVCIRPLPFR